MAGENTPAIRVATPGESGRDHIIVSPFQFYVNGEDHLRVTSANSLTGVVLEITGRFFDEDTQKISPLLERHTPNTDRSIKQTLIRLGKGYVLNLAVRAVTGSPVVGQTFVILELVRGFDGATQFLGVMTQGYVTSRQGLAWPGSPIQSSIEGGGYLRTIAGTVPAAGVDISETVPTGARWQLLALAAQLATSATVINRMPMLTFDDGAGAIFYRAQANQSQPQSVSYQYDWGIMGPTRTFVVTANDMIGFPNMVLPIGARIRTATANIQAGDQWSVFEYLVREWLEAN